MKEEPSRFEGSHVTGVRAEESNNRAQQERKDKNGNWGYEQYKPIFDWSIQDVWNYIYKHGLPYLKLYENEGCRRVGCVICPFQSYKEKLRSMRDFPRFWKLLKLYCNKLYNKYHETVDWIGRFRDGDDIYEWWLADMSMKKWFKGRS